jgi:hypothetical protein
MQPLEIQILHLKQALINEIQQLITQQNGEEMRGTEIIFTKTHLSRGEAGMTFSSLSPFVIEHLFRLEARCKILVRQTSLFGQIKYTRDNKLYTIPYSNLDTGSLLLILKFLKGES